jgi:hypothetical protein
MSQREEPDSPTLPLPPPRSEASRVTLEDLIEAATRAAQRGALQAPGSGGGVQPYHPPIWVGIIIHPPSPFVQVQTAEEVSEG